MPLSVGPSAAAGGARATVPGERWRLLYGKVQVVCGMLFCLICIVYASYMPFRSYVNQYVQSAKKGVTGFLESRYDPVRPEKVTASTSLKGHEASKAADQYSNTYWAAAFDGQGKREKESRTLTFGFGRIVTLDQMIVTSGSIDSFTEHGRPRLIVLTYSNGKTVNFTLKDTSKPQKFELSGALGVKSVNFTVGQVFPSDEHKDVAIAEVEFFSLIS